MRMGERSMRIVLVEDQVMLRELLTLFLGVQEDMEVVEVLGDASHALAAVEDNEADLVLMDICTEGGSSGLVAAHDIKAAYPECRIVLMTGTPDITHMHQAQEAGVEGFIYKDAELADLLTTLRYAHKGYTVFPSEERAKVRGMSFNDDEVRLLRLICDGCSRKQISEQLGLSQGTIKRRVGELLAKTGHENVFKLAVTAVAKGYIDPGVKRREGYEDELE